MKKTELKNCPQWLLDASTKNEDVDFDEYGFLIWSGVEFLGGYFRGEKISVAKKFQKRLCLFSILANGLRQ